MSYRHRFWDRKMFKVSTSGHMVASSFFACMVLSMVRSPVRQSALHLLARSYVPNQFGRVPFSSECQQNSFLHQCIYGGGKRELGRYEYSVVVLVLYIYLSNAGRDREEIELAVLRKTSYTAITRAGSAWRLAKSQLGTRFNPLVLNINHGHL